MSGRRVALLQRRLVEYRVPLFEALRERLAASGVTLVLAHGAARPSEASRRDEGALAWAARVPTRYLPGPEGAGVVLAIPAGLLAGCELVVMPGDPGFLPLYRFVARRALGRGPRVAFWGHGANFQAPGGERGARRALRRWVNGRPDWWFAYTRLSVDRIAADGFPPERITRLDNSVDTAALARWRDTTTPAALEGLRTGLGLGPGPRAVFLGSLHAHRRLPLLFAAADLVRGRLPGFELLVVGDGPLAGAVREFAAARPWVRWTGALHGPEKARHALLGSVLAIPGMVGLAILDGFALGLPVVTTDAAGHSPEIAYLDAGRNGVVAAATPAAYADALAALLADPGRRERMAAACREDARRYTVEGMAERFAGGILAALGGAP